VALLALEEVGQHQRVRVLAVAEVEHVLGQQRGRGTVRQLGRELRICECYVRDM